LTISSALGVVLQERGVEDRGPQYRTTFRHTAAPRTPAARQRGTQNLPAVDSPHRRPRGLTPVPQFGVPKSPTETRGRDLLASASGCTASALRAVGCFRTQRLRLQPQFDVIERHDKGRGNRFHRFGLSFGEQVIRERRPHVVGEAGNEPVQPNAVDTAAKWMCNANAHIDLDT